MDAKHNPRAPADFDLQMGERITALRKLRGLSQADLGAACGISHQQVQKYEKGHTRICTSRLQSLSDALGVTAAELLNSSGESTVLQQLRQPDVVDLLQAFEGIHSPAMRHQMVNMVRMAAGTPQIEQAA